MPWTLCYRPTRGAPEVQTSIRANTAAEAWLVWGAWRNAHKIWDYYNIHAQEVDDDGKVIAPTSSHTPSPRSGMTHLYAVPPAQSDLPAPEPSTPSSSLLKESAFPGLKAEEIWPPAATLAPVTTTTLTLVPAEPPPIDPNKWPTTAAFERGDELAEWTWSYRVWSGYGKKTPKPSPGSFLRGTLAELIAAWNALGASVHCEAKELDLHSCYIKGRWAGMIRQDPLNKGTYITTTPEDRN